MCDSDSQLKWYVDQTGTTAAQRLMTMASDAHKETLRIRKKEWINMLFNLSWFDSKLLHE